MESIIQLLPDAIANQIAAGEVVQRPASVVKELLENAIDAGASRIDLYIKDAGKTLIQVTDNGCGMSAADARMAFERHATSKIKTQDDLFKIRTLGFRGEALASIAAIAQVSLKTRLHDADLGQEISIEGGDFKGQEPCTGPVGSTFSVKNLFFNVPARRNFLKSNPVETRHILNEFIRVAIPHPELHFTFRHNTTEVYNLAPMELPDRLAALFGQDLEGRLLPIEEVSDYVTLHGLVGDPSVVRKHKNEQFFFVNGRYIRSPYLNHALMGAYAEVLPKEAHPLYCIFLEIDPVHVDINIHPTKTEVKFDDERTIYVLLQSMVKRVLGGKDKAPIFDFSDEKIRDEIYSKTALPQRDSPTTVGDIIRSRKTGSEPLPKPEAWDALYQAPASASPPVRKHPQPNLFGDKVEPLAPRNKEAEDIEVRTQLPGGFAIVSRRNMLLLVHLRRAQKRVFFERFLDVEGGSKLASQQLLFPQTVSLSAGDYLALQEATEILRKLGFDIQDLGNHTLIVYGTPSDLAPSKIETVLQQVAADVASTGMSRVHEKMFAEVAKSVATRASVPKSQSLPDAELKPLMQALFQCEAPAYCPYGKLVFSAFDPRTLLG